jgi:hypothetical protein
MKTQLISETVRLSFGWFYPVGVAVLADLVEKQI